MTKPRNKLTNEAKRQAERERRRRIRDDQVKPWVQLSKKDKKNYVFSLHVYVHEWKSPKSAKLIRFAIFLCVNENGSENRQF